MRRSKKIIFSEEEKQYIINEYVNKKISKRNLAKKMQVSEGVINRVLRDNDIDIRGVAESNSKEIPLENEQVVIENYLEKGMGLCSAGKEFGYSQKVVETILKRYGIHKRTYVESKQIQRVYSCNDNYFKHQNSEMAYILGFIAADGSVSKKENGIFINLHQKDSEILERIKNATNSTRPISYYTKKSTGQELCKFSVWSYEWKQDLSKYGIVPAKTFILEPPLFLDSKYYKDYIRGYFDADGSVYVRKNKIIEDVPLVKIEGASKNFMNWLNYVLANQYNIYTSSYYSHKLSNNDTIMYSYNLLNYDNVLKFYKLIYKDNPSLYLKRKKNKFDSLLKTPRDSISLV